MKEEWKAVVGYEGRYEVSSFGKIRSIERVTCFRERWGGIAHRKSKGEEIKPDFSGQGYARTKMYKDSKRFRPFVHRVVMEAFVGPIPDNMEVMHLDGNKKNNNIENLRYGSHQCNMAFQVDHGTELLGEQCNSSILDRFKVGRIKEFLRVGITRSELAKSFGVGYSTIADIQVGRTWGHVA